MNSAAALSTASVTFASAPLAPECLAGVSPALATPSCARFASWRATRFSIRRIARCRDVPRDRKSTRLNSSHGYISYAVFCLKKKKKQTTCQHIEVEFQEESAPE